MDKKDEEEARQAGSQVGAWRWYSQGGWGVRGMESLVMDVMVDIPQGPPSGNVQVTVGDRLRSIVAKVSLAEWGEGDSG